MPFALRYKHILFSLKDVQMSDSITTIIYVVVVSEKDKVWNTNEHVFTEKEKAMTFARDGMASGDYESMFVKSFVPSSIEKGKWNMWECVEM